MDYDVVRQYYFQCIVNFPMRWYNVTLVRLGIHFMKWMMVELKGAQTRDWNFFFFWAGLRDPIV